tara:strand:+ start:95 stop:367 length:273 start_codon:yes stop_codon:yes gene_type:complete
MRDSFRPNVRLATNILMVIGTFLIAFNLSKISTVDRDQQIKEDCSRVVARAMTYEEFVKKYKLNYENEEYDTASSSSRKFCTQYTNPYRL